MVTKRGGTLVREKGRVTDRNVTLEWNFQQGRRLRYRLTQSNEITSNSSKSWSDPARNEVSLLLILDIEGTDNRGVATIRVTVDKVSFKRGFITDSFGYVEYDSEVDLKAMKGRTLASLKGRSFCVTVAPDGEVKSVKIEDRRIRDVVSEPRMTYALQNLFWNLPSTPVRRGARWEGLSRLDDTLMSGMMSAMQLHGFELEVKRTTRLDDLPKKRTEAALAMKSVINVKSRSGGPDDVELHSPSAEGECTWLMDKGVLGSSTSIVDLTVSRVMIHACRLRTRTTVKLMPSEESPPSASIRSTVGLSRDDLHRMVQELEGLFDKIAPVSGPHQPIAQRIKNASFDRLVPRRIAAWMKSVTETRNASVHERFDPSPQDSVAVRSAWNVVRAWAAGKGTNLSKF